METSVRWRYRVKLLEKIYYIGLLSLGFLVYKSPGLLSWFLSDYPLTTISIFSLSIIGFSMAGFMLDKRSRKAETLAKKLKEKLKDAKRMLISQMDPELVKVVKEIVKADMKEDIERLKNSDEGCSQKCKLTHQMLKLDIDRHEVLIKELIEFQWCDTCKTG